MTLIELQEVTKSYYMGKELFHALKGIQLSIEHGDLAAIIGPSGSGKSSTMNILGLLAHPTTGKYYLDGIDVADFSIDELSYLRNQKIGFIFQSFFLLPKLTALQNVSLPLFYRDVDRKQSQIKALAMLEKVGLREYANHRPSELSGGQQQRVAIARALVGDPAIILADEPTGALDVKTTRLILDLLIEFNRVEKTTIIIITHDPQVAKLCSRRIEIYDGKIRSEERG